MFWGLVLKANKQYSQTVQKAFHLSQAALDLSKCREGEVRVMLTSADSTYLLCTLNKRIPQVPLDLNFDEGNRISLSTKGEGVVHLTGYLVPSEEDFFGGDDDEELEASPQKGNGKQTRSSKPISSKNDDDAVAQLTKNINSLVEISKTIDLHSPADENYLVHKTALANIDRMLQKLPADVVEDTLFELTSLVYGKLIRQP